MKKIVSLILVLALLLALTACGSGTSAGTAETTAPASTVDDSKGTQIDADGSVITSMTRPPSAPTRSFPISRSWSCTTASPISWVPNISPPWNILPSP